MPKDAGGFVSQAVAFSRPGRKPLEDEFLRARNFQQSKILRRMIRRKSGHCSWRRRAKTGFRASRESGDAAHRTLDRDRPHPDLLVTFAGNHDVSRLASAKGTSLDKIKLAFSIVLTMRGTPELYYGDEIGMTGGDDPDNGRDFPGGKQNAFTQSGRTPEQQEIFSHVQRLLSLRKEHPALRHGELWDISWDESAYAFARSSREERLLVVFNSGSSAKTLHRAFGDTPPQGAQKLTPLVGEHGAELSGDTVDLRLAPNELEIFSVQ